MQFEHPLPGPQLGFAAISLINSDMQQRTDSKLGKEYIKALYDHLA